jgi:type IV pilus assembly protein PilA
MAFKRGGSKLPPLFFTKTHETSNAHPDEAHNWKFDMSKRNTIRRGQRKARSLAGFSLIELLVVVAIILIIAAIAIPNLLRARMSANQAAAVSNLRTITSASVIYSTTWGNGFPPALTALGGSGTATCNQGDLLDPILSTAPFVKSGYQYAYTGVGAPVTPVAGCGAPGFNEYLTTTVPSVPGLTGQVSYCSDEPATIHYDITGATPSSEAQCEALPSL